MRPIPVREKTVSVIWRLWSGPRKDVHVVSVLRLNGGIKPKRNTDDQCNWTGVSKILVEFDPHFTTDFCQ